MAASAWRHRIGSGVSASPPSSTASAAKDSASAASPASETAHPTARRGVGDPEALGRRANPAPGRHDGSRWRHRWTRSSRGDSAPRTPGAGRGSSQQVRTTPRGTQILWALPVVADEPRVARPERHRLEARRAIRPRDLDFSAGGRVGVDGQRAGPYDCHRWQHRLGPLPQASDQLAAGGVPRVQGPHILAVAGLTGPSSAQTIRNEHRRKPYPNPQIVTPPTDGPRL